MRKTFPLIPSDSMVEHGRVNRPPLLTWVADLVEKVNEAESRATAWPQIDGILNNASLIEVYRGDQRAAEELCELQLRWVAGLMRTHGAVAAGELCVQPWINIGRIRRIQGDRAAALRHFGILPDTLAGKPLRLGPVVLDAATWQEAVRGREMLPNLKALYVIDSARTYFMARDWAGALDFLREARGLVGDEPFPLLDEAELLTLAKLGRYDEAMAVSERPAWAEDAYCKLLKVTYRVALLAAGGSAEQARRLIAQLADRVLSGGLDRPHDQRVLRYLEYLGGLVWELGHDELAARVFHLGLRAARSLVDVPIELSLLETLIEVDGAGDREALSAERAGLLDRCLYVPLLRARGIKADPAALDAPIFAELHRRLRAIAEEGAALRPAASVNTQAP